MRNSCEICAKTCENTILLRKMHLFFGQKNLDVSKSYKKL